VTPPAPTASRALRDLSELADPGRALIWDLDGTLVDSSRDIASGVAGALGELGLPPLSRERVLRNVGRGVGVLMRQCLEACGRPPEDEADLDRAVDLFRIHYARHMLETTRPYADLDQVLLELHARGRLMALVSNKPADFTRQLVEHLGLASCFRAILGGDSLPTRKPSGEPFLHALTQCGPSATPASAAAIGDSLIDVEAARAAGIAICGVGWGFDPDGCMPKTTLDWWVQRPEEMRAVLLGG
jgi:phosphoglycolate phosphatase